MSNGFNKAQSHLSLWWGVIVGLLIGVPLTAWLVIITL